VGVCLAGLNVQFMCVDFGQYTVHYSCWVSEGDVGGGGGEKHLPSEALTTGTY
jgi:hypothetical protein